MRVARENLTEKVQPRLLLRRARATNVLIPGADDGDALAQRLELRQRGSQGERVRQGEPRAAHDVRP
eukprot:2151750-Pyramimonas_sp.AAC.1